MKQKVRYISADILRGLVILIMIEVHVFNSFLLPELKQTAWFSVLNFINGLVAPSFLFVSGFAFQVSSGNKLEEMRKFGKAFWKKIGRILQIVIIGYALHLPFYSLSKFINENTPATMESIYAIDILQCIGFGLLFLFGFRLLIRSDKLYNYFLTASLTLILIISPLIWQIDFNNYLHPLAGNYFNRLHGSLFPVFPWLNFLLAGAIFARYYVNARETNKENIFIKNILKVSLVIIILGHLFYSGLFSENLTSIIPNPVFYFERLGYIVVLFTICRFVEKTWNVKKSFILDASRESLLIYWLHLVIIFGAFWEGKSLAIKIGTTLNLIETVIVTLLLMGLMILIAKIWGWVKTNYPRYAFLFVNLSVFILVIFFIFK